MLVNKINMKTLNQNLFINSGCNGEHFEEIR